MLVHYVGNFMMMFVMLFIIAFLLLLFLVKNGSKRVMKFLGADIFTFDLKKRLKIISIMSAVIAFVLTIVFCIVF